MNNKKFIMMLSCLTAAFCVLIVVYNFASMPPYGAEAASAVALYNSSSQQSESIQESSEVQTDSQISETDDASSGTVSASTSKSSKKSANTKTASSNSTVNSTVSMTTSAQSKTASTKEVPQSPVNINTANLEQLETIPYIGPTKAQAILDYRSQNGSFKSVDELDSVKGIGAKTIDKIRQYITVG